MPLAKDMTNQAKQDFPVDAILNGGSSMSRGESLQKQIELGPVRALSAPTITGWKDANGKAYSTSVAQQLAYNAQALARIEGQLATVVGVLSQVAQAANKGVAVNIDYDKIAAMMPKAPEYKLTPIEDAK